MVFYNSIDQVREAFFDFGAPVWLLYNGKGKTTYPKGATELSNILARQRETSWDINDSWALLQQKLRVFAIRGGYAHIYQGSPDDFINIPIYFPHTGQVTEGGENLSRPAVSGFAAMGYPDFNIALEKERQLWELEKRVEELGNSKVSGIGERIIENIIESPQLPALISGLINALGRLAGTSNLPAPAVSSIQMPPQQQTDVGPEYEEYDDTFRQRISRHFDSADEMESSLQKLAMMFEADPEGMKNLLKQMR